ncbi:MAG: hypothetical protein HY225_02775 [Candidatus Vogelbacteria bacterium]|nr:hypothetical protein [Candidatus Vogelbacteria bacterium]
MEKISSFLERFKNLGIPDEKTRYLVADAIWTAVQEKIDVKNISLKNHVVYIKCDSSTKGEIFIKKKKILEIIQTKEGEGSVVIDIR